MDLLLSEEEKRHRYRLRKDGHMKLEAEVGVKLQKPGGKEGSCL